MSKGRIASLFFVGVGLFIFIQSIRLPLGNFSRPLAGFFPLLLSTMLIIVGLLLLMTDKKTEKMVWREVPQFYLSISWQIVILTAAYILAFEWLGFLVASFLYLLFLFYICGRLRVWSALGLAALLTIGSWGLFVKLLDLQLPRGIWSL